MEGGEPIADNRWQRAEGGSRPPKHAWHDLWTVPKGPSKIGFVGPKLKASFFYSEIGRLCCQQLLVLNRSAHFYVTDEEE